MLGTLSALVRPQEQQRLTSQMDPKSPKWLYMLMLRAVHKNLGNFMEKLANYNMREQMIRDYHHPSHPEL